MARSYDLAVIGSGVAATTIATAVRAAGWAVAAVDHREFGGTCALRGCDPKKVLVSAARAVAAGHRLDGRGVSGEVRIDWAALMAFKRTFTDPVPAERELLFTDAGIDVLHGRARFLAPDSIEVGGEALAVRHVALAVGSAPVPLPIPGAEHVRTSDDFLALEQLPRRIVLIGGGYIAAEFAHVAALAGAEVTVLQRAGRMLTGFDADLVGWLMPAFRERGIDVRCDVSVEGVAAEGAGFVVHARGADGVREVPADMVFHAAGRAPDLDDLDLAAGGVERGEDGGLRLNAFLQSASNPAVYAAGDAAAVGLALTPVASRDGEVVAANLLGGNARRPEYGVVPTVAFTIPPLASVGLGEEAARRRGLRFRINAASVPHWATARRIGETVYGYKVLVEEGTGTLLGAHLVGPEADEVINVFALALRLGMTAEGLKAAVFSYPTGASDIGYML